MVCPERILAMKLGFALPIVGSAVARATVASRKIRASAAVEGTGVIPKSRIFSWTLIGP
jgi:hypothetical protein